MSITPLNINSPASVTMKDGSLSRVMRVPCHAPMSAQPSSAAVIAAHHGHRVVVGCTS